MSGTSECTGSIPGWTSWFPYALNSLKFTQVTRTSFSGFKNGDHHLLESRATTPLLCDPPRCAADVMQIIRLFFERIKPKRVQRESNRQAQLDEELEIGLEYSII